MKVIRKEVINDNQYISDTFKKNQSIVNSINNIKKTLYIKVKGKVVPMYNEKSRSKGIVFLQFFSNLRNFFFPEFDVASKTNSLTKTIFFSFTLRIVQILVLIVKFLFLTSFVTYFLYYFINENSIVIDVQNSIPIGQSQKQFNKDLLVTIGLMDKYTQRNNKLYVFIGTRINDVIKKLSYKIFNFVSYYLYCLLYYITFTMIDYLFVVKLDTTPICYGYDFYSRKKLELGFYFRICLSLSVFVMVAFLSVTFFLHNLVFLDFYLRYTNNRMKLPRIFVFIISGINILFRSICFVTNAFGTNIKLLFFLHLVQTTMSHNNNVISRNTFIVLMFIGCERLYMTLYNFEKRLFETNGMLYKCINGYTMWSIVVFSYKNFFKVRKPFLTTIYFQTFLNDLVCMASFVPLLNIFLPLSMKFDFNLDKVTLTLVMFHFLRELIITYFNAINFSFNPNSERKNKGYIISYISTLFITKLKSYEE